MRYCQSIGYSWARKMEQRITAPVSTMAKGMKFYTRQHQVCGCEDVSHAIVALLQSRDWDTIKNQRYVLSAKISPTVNSLK